MKLQADECSVKATGFGITTNVEEAMSTLKDYATTTGKLVGAVTAANATKVEVMIAPNNELLQKLLTAIKILNAKATTQASIINQNNNDQNGNKMHNRNSKHCSDCKHQSGYDKCWEMQKIAPRIGC